MIKQLISTILIGLLMIPGAMAEDEYDPGWITPDSYLWELDLRIERLQEKFAINDAHRTSIRIAHMNERLGEMQTGEKYDKVSARYMEQIERIETNTVRYDSVERVRDTFLLHMAEIYNMTAETYGNETALMEQVRNRIEAGETTMEDAGKDIIDNESVWFDAKAAQYGVTSTPTPISNYGDFDKYARHLEDGSTLVNIVSSDGEIVQSYTINKISPELPGAVMDPITIQTGTTPTFVDKYTITIEQLQKYDALL